MQDVEVWGNIAEWFAAIGTVGALVATVVIIVRDKRRVKESDAQAVAVSSVTVTGTNRSTTSQTSDHVPWLGAEIQVYNGGAFPIKFVSINSRRRCEVIYRSGSWRDWKHEGWKPPRLWTSIPPGQTRNAVIRPFEWGPGSTIVTFTDAHGRRWSKSTTGGKLMTSLEGLQSLNQRPGNWWYRRDRFRKAARAMWPFGRPKKGDSVTVWRPNQPTQTIYAPDTT